MAPRRLLTAVTFGILAIIAVSAIAAGVVYWYLNPPVIRDNGIVYTRRHGQELTFNVIQPRNPNGLGVIVIVSGGWKSQKDPVQTWLVAPLLRRGYTLFTVSHLSQPEATVMEIVEDIHRAVRSIRSRARNYGVDPDRLGVTGGSAG
ncbi:MAG: alpha/beta hydrolase, partial [Verrucomicrobiae bacterium]|nr:alpha/beta hydrolase [Verrucomicrobiae bacterium]